VGAPMLRESLAETHTWVRIWNVGIGGLTISLD
jgi:hypothetical protein